MSRKIPKLQPIVLYTVKAVKKCLMEIGETLPKRAAFFLRKSNKKRASTEIEALFKHN